MPPYDTATHLPVGAVSAPFERSDNRAWGRLLDPETPSETAAKRTSRGRHSTLRRLHFGRFVLLVLACLLTSSGVVYAAKFMPPEPAEMMADPDFDVAAFYQTHPTSVSGNEIAYAFAPGLPAVPKPVGGLSQAQTVNAFIVIEVGRQMGLPKRAYVVAITTALQETVLRNLANTKVSSSLKLPHEGVGSNFDSVGVFQQRPSQGWGTVSQLMDPAQAASRFYAKLMRINNWQNLSIGGAAQAVQRSAFSSAYTKHVEQATTIVEKMPAYS